MSVDLLGEHVTAACKNSQQLPEQVAPIEPELERYQLKIPPEKIHHLLYYATMFIGDSQTMTSESAILGTPALKCNSFAHRLSLPNLLEKRYELCYAYRVNEFEDLISHLDELLKQDGIKSLWQERVKKFLEDSIDPTAFLVWILENYPGSFKELMARKESIMEMFKQ